MVSFSCEACGDVLTKKKLDPHRNQCRGASFTCLDCMVHFQGSDYRAHTSCISEAQKYQGALYRDTSKKRKSMNGHGRQDDQAMVPRNAYVEDAPDDGNNEVAIVDVPPRAPTPPLPEGINVFDFLVQEATPDGSRRELEAPTNGHAMYYQNGDTRYSNGNGDSHGYTQHGYSYGHAPVQTTFERYDSWQEMPQQSQGALMPPPPPYATPGPRRDKSDRKEKSSKGEKSDKKRKRGHVEELDLSASKRPTSRGGDTAMTEAAPAMSSSGGRLLHSGLTGGLSKLVTDPEFYDDRIEAGPTPISPIKRSKHDQGSKHEREAKDQRRKSSYTSYSTTTAKSTSSKHSEDKPRHRRSRSPDRSESKHSSKSHHRRRRDSSSSPEDRHRSSTRRIEYQPSRSERPASVQPSASNQLAVSYQSKADFFLSFITKGPDSEKGVSINKALKRYHRERDVKYAEEKEEDDKELWKSLRLRRNDRGEIVLFTA